TGGEADELRRAMGSKRSAERMKRIEERLRAGMAKNGIAPQAQDEIVQGITSFALYGFPESHAASFALLVYASAYLKAHHGAAFAAALLNCWPMGFYSPATIVKDAQRHGVRVLPIDVARSDWLCTLQGGVKRSTTKDTKGTKNLFLKKELRDLRGDLLTPLCVRLGLKYVRGLREEAAKKIVELRPFHSIAELAARC